MDKEKDKQKDMSRDIKGYLWISQDKMGYVGQWKDKCQDKSNICKNGQLEAAGADEQLSY